MVGPLRRETEVAKSLGYFRQKPERAGTILVETSLGCLRLKPKTAGTTFAIAGNVIGEILDSADTMHSTRSQLI